MNYLLDTCVISELIKPTPDENVVNWCNSISEYHFYLCVITFGELYKGIEKLANSRRKKILHDWVEHDLKERFESRIIPIDLKVMEHWGQIQGKAEKAGKTMPSIDSLIAATGMAYDLTVVTRNVKDMQNSGVKLLNPWESTDS